MRTKNLFAMTALAVALFAAGSAQANFDYSVAPTSPFVGGQSVSGAATLSSGPAVSAGNLSTPTDIVIANPTYSSTSTSSQSLTFNYGYTLTITNPAGSGVSQDFTVTGQITGTGSATASSLRNTSFTSTPSTQVISGTTFVVTAFAGTAPQAGGVPGALNVHVDTVSGPPVPEPASIALMGLGGLGALGLFRRRRAAKA